MQNQYIETGVVVPIVQDMPTSSSTDVVEIQITRESDGFYWDFTALAFVPTVGVGTTGIMTSINGSWWKSSFIPPTDDIYLILIDDTTLDSQNSQVLTSVTDVTPSPTPIPVPTPPVGVQALIDQAKKFMPSRFIAKVDDTRITAFLELVLADINAVSPYTNFTLDNMPQGWGNIVCFGANLYASMFLLADYSLQDFSYSDNGLSLQIDRSARIGPLYEKMLVQYALMKQNLKKAIAVSTGGKGLITNQYFSLVSQFISGIFPGTMSHQ